jgi:3',5'-cyclic AMP phosphodiesterase CpdA
VRTLLHLSDLHFGRIDYDTIEPLIETAGRLNPDVVVVSGDLTQRARSSQFKEARAFLDSLPSPQIVVPGNHDIPMHDVFRRFVRPLDRYRRFISSELSPFYRDEEIAIAGVNTARSLKIKGGRINEEQVSWARAKLCALGDDVTKLVVTHHPFDLPAGHGDRDLVGRARMAINILASCEADIFLSGHLHTGHAIHAASRFNIGGRSLLFIQAGTATSTRRRGEANSFNVITIDRPHVTVARYSWDAPSRSFRFAEQQKFQKGDAGWSPSRP